MLDEGQRQVDPGGDAGRRPHLARIRTIGVRQAADVDRVGVDLDGRPVLGECCGTRPVGGHPVAVERTRRRGDQCARAHGDQARRAVDECGHGGHRRGIVDHGADAESARNDHRVDRAGVLAGPRVERARVEPDGALRRHRPAAQRHDRDVVPLLGREHQRRPCQHLGRSGDIERLDAVVHEDRHSLHGNTVRHQGRGVNATDPTIPAIPIEARFVPAPSPNEPSTALGR